MPVLFKRKGVFAACAALALGVTSADAAVFDWSFSAAGISGGGTMTATQDPVNTNTFTLTAISGQVNGAAISGLSSYDGADQLVFYPNPPNVVVDTLGFSFGVGDGSQSYNIYEDFGNFTPGTYFACGQAYCLLGPGPSDSSNINVGVGSDAVMALDSLTLSAAAPEVSTWAMMLLGFAGLGFAGYRNARRAPAA